MQPSTCQKRSTPTGFGSSLPSSRPEGASKKRGSFEEAREAIRRASGVEVGKRQVEQRAQRSAVDFEDFYETTAHEAVEGTDVRAIVKSCGSKISQAATDPSSHWGAAL